MTYFIGILIGLVLAIIVFLATKRYETTINRTIKQLESSIQQKGEVFIEDENVEDLKAWVNNLPKE